MSGGKASQLYSFLNRQARLGFIGTGVMGRYMCEHLMKSGCNMTVYNRSISKADPLIKLGAKFANSPKEVALNSDIVFMIVGYPHDVREVVLDNTKGLLEGTKENNIIVDMTTSEPSLAKEIAKIASKKGVHCLDAPVSGGDVGAKNATLSIMVGGNQNTFEIVKPFFELMGKNIRYLGPTGNGQHTKMVNQIAIANNMIGVCEALLYAHKSGLSLEDTIAAIGQGAAASFSLNILGTRITKGDYEPGFFVEHFIKDMGIALEESKKMNLSLPGLALAQQLYIALKSQGYGRKGTQSLILALEKLNGLNHFESLDSTKRNQSKL